MADRSLPPGWPVQVRPPDAPEWVISAVAFLFDQCPADYRAHEVLRHHPVILARFAAEHVGSAIRAAREGLGTVRSDLRELVPPEAVTAAVAAYEREGARLVRVQREVALVSAALRGERYVGRL